MNTFLSAFTVPLSRELEDFFLTLQRIKAERSQGVKRHAKALIANSLARLFYDCPTPNALQGIR